jgi:hypothetical protein
MSRTETFDPRFVDELPDDLEQGVLYISMEFATAAHSCACGCGSRVLTPLRSNRWRMTFDGERIWLCPSIGNWNFSCKAHYWILGNAVRWAAEMTPTEIKAIRASSRQGWAALDGVDMEPMPPEPSDERAAVAEPRTARWPRARRLLPVALRRRNR